MAEAAFMPGAPAGFVAESGFRGFEQGQSMMLRAQAAKREEQLARIREQQAQQELVMAPLRIEQQKAETANAVMQYRSALNMQQTEAELAPLVGEAQREFKKGSEEGEKAEADKPADSGPIS